jgi:hypothetical protein
MKDAFMIGHAPAGHRVAAAPQTLAAAADRGPLQIPF